MHPGQRIGKYVLGDKIAVGGMAEVWAARAEGPQGFIKPVALKFILESFSGDPELERLFVKEARIAAQLQHANLVAVFDFDKVATDPDAGHAGRYYIAMEHVEGYDARRVVEAANHAGYVFPMPLALYLGGEVLKGLRYVHERREKGRLLGLVHRDVSPHNVLVGFSGEVKLSDFGIAKSLAHSTRTKTGTIRGKLSYASPEQLNGEPVDQRTDQFAMGITLWEILAGRPLFDGNDEIEIVGKVMRCDVPPLALVCPERKVPAAVEAFTRRMLSPRRDQRFSTTTDALSALLALPGYSADGAPLGELVRTLFHRPSVGSTSTMNVPESPAATARAPGAGRSAESRGSRRASPRPSPAAGPARGPGRAAGVAGPGERPARPSEIETRTMARSPASPGAGAAAGPGPGRRALASGPSAATTARVRTGWGRRLLGRMSWGVMAAVAAVAAVAVAAAVLASGGRGESAGVAPAVPEAERAAPASSPVAPLPQMAAAPPAAAPPLQAGPLPGTAAGAPPPAPTDRATEGILEPTALQTAPPTPRQVTESGGPRVPIRAASLSPSGPAPPPASPAPVQVITLVPPVVVAPSVPGAPAAGSTRGASPAPAPPPAAPHAQQEPGSFETAAITVRAAPAAAAAPAHGDAAANGAPIVE